MVHPLDVWPRLCRFLSSENIAYTLFFTMLVINPNFQTSVPSAEQALSRGNLPSSLFRKVTQQYISLLEYANSANSLFLESISQLSGGTF